MKRTCRFLATKPGVRATLLIFCFLAPSQLQYSSVFAQSLSQEDSNSINGDTVWYVPGNATNNLSNTSGCGTTTLSGNTNGVQAYNYFIQKGLSPSAASGIVGNMTEESAGVNPEQPQGSPTYGYTIPQSVPSAQLSPVAINDKTFGWGIVQWTPPGPKIIAYGKQQNVPPTTVDTLAFQLQYLWDVGINGSALSGGGTVLSQLQTATTPEDGATIFLNAFEGGNPNPTRQAYARAYYNLAVNGTPLPPNVPTFTSDSPIGNGTAPAGTSSCSGSTNSPSGYSNPFHSVTGLVASRIDEGVDYSSTKPVPIYAIGNGTVTVATSHSTFYTTSGGYADWITYRLTDGPAAGKYIYVSEACSPILVTVGEQVTSNTQLCSVLSDSIETGWALDSSSQAAAAYTSYVGHDGYETAYGVNFNQLIVSLGGPGGHLDSSSDPSGQILGTLPSSWPLW